MWLTNVFPLIPNKSALVSGYHHGDDFFDIDVFPEWFKVYDGLSALYGKDVMFLVPLKRERKTEILKKLKQYGIYDCTWHCEIPNNTGKCGRCVPCETHDQAMAYIDKRDKESAKMLTYKDDVEKSELSKPVEIIKDTKVSEEEINRLKVSSDYVNDVGLVKSEIELFNDAIFETVHASKVIEDLDEYNSKIE
jgi:hypothetical protein